MPQSEQTRPPDGPEQVERGSIPFRASQDRADAAAATERLKAALRRTPIRHSRGYEAAMRDVRAAVYEMVDVLHNAGLAPEKVLVRVKAQLSAHGTERADLLDGIVRWCIARYYDGDGAAPIDSSEPLK